MNRFRRYSMISRGGSSQAASVGRRRLRGSTAAEYLVGLAVMIATLIMPIPGMDQSLLTWFMDALSAFQANTTVLMSIP